MDEPSVRAALARAEEASSELRGANPKDALERMGADYPATRAALDWLIEQQRADDALRLANALYRYWITKQAFEEGGRWFDRVLDLPGGARALTGQAYVNAGFMPFWMGHDEQAAALFRQGMAMARELGDVALESQALGGLSRVALRTDVAEGRRLAGEALAISDAAGDVAGRSNALHLLGVGAQIAGDLVEARAWMTQRLELVRSQGNDFLAASEAANLSMVERQLGELDTAEALAREALETSERIGDRFMTPFVFSGLASIATERGGFERAARLVGAAEKLMDEQNMAWPPDERPHYDRLLDVLPGSMGSEDFEEARAAGRSMPTAEAIDLALGRSSSAG
jgi:non-specific serine/threonine protein kinase